MDHASRILVHVKQARPAPLAGPSGLAAHNSSFDAQWKHIPRHVILLATLFPRLSCEGESYATFGA